MYQVPLIESGEKARSNADKMMTEASNESALHRVHQVYSPLQPPNQTFPHSSINNAPDPKGGYDPTHPRQTTHHPILPHLRQARPPAYHCIPIVQIQP